VLGSAKDHSNDNDLALVLGGGGARAAHQVGLLSYLGKTYPDLRLRIVTGVSAGGINACYLASHPGTLLEAAQGLRELWDNLTPDRIFKADAGSLARQVSGWVLRLTSGGSRLGPRMKGLVDTEPLSQLLSKVLPHNPNNRILEGIDTNLERGPLRAVALTTLNYSTGETVTWVQGREIRDWERPGRRSYPTRLTIDHIMASAALPLFFPAIRLAGHWHGDGGVRLSAPLSPALHLGAKRILVVSTRYQPSSSEAQAPSISGYPPPAQILGHLLNAVFLDVLDQDVLRLERLNRLLRDLPERKRHGLKPVDILVIRPSENLSRLSADYEPRLPKGFRFLTRSLGTRETKSPDFLSLLMFQPDYLKHLIDLGEKDAESQGEEIDRLVRGEG
jgi:NTE family protein